MKPFRILLVDDSAPFRRQVGSALEASGLSVVEATEGFEAMWRARADATFDLVLLDIHMPSLDGLTFIREVRKIPGYSEVPIIVVTSDGSRERRLEGRAAGATAWLLKPPDLPGLINAVHAALMRGRKNESPPRRPRSAAPSLAPYEPRPSSELPSRAPHARLLSEPSPASPRPSAGVAARGSSLPPAAARGTLPAPARVSAPSAARVSSPPVSAASPVSRVSSPPASRVSPPTPRASRAPESARAAERPAIGRGLPAPVSHPPGAAVPAPQRPQAAGKPPVEIDE